MVRNIFFPREMGWDGKGEGEGGWGMGDGRGGRRMGGLVGMVFRL